jgi:hypothetical protein
MKNVGGVTMLRLQNDIFMKSITFYDDDETEEEFCLKVNVLVERDRCDKTIKLQPRAYAATSPTSQLCV